jgi:hypothetical protein
MVTALEPAEAKVTAWGPGPVADAGVPVGNVHARLAVRVDGWSVLNVQARPLAGLTVPMAGPTSVTALEPNVFGPWTATMLTVIPPYRT